MGETMVAGKLGIKINNRKALGTEQRAERRHLAVCKHPDDSQSHAEQLRVNQKSNIWVILTEAGKSERGKGAQVTREANTWFPQGASVKIRVSCSTAR